VSSDDEGTAAEDGTGWRGPYGKEERDGHGISSGSGNPGKFPDPDSLIHHLRPGPVREPASWISYRDPDRVS